MSHRRRAVVPLAAGALAALVALPVPAPAGEGGPLLRFARFDLNRDGRITAEEARAVGTVRFLRLDGNADGAVTRAEMAGALERWLGRAPARARLERVFARLDRNGDGRVERVEFEEAVRYRFRRADRDGDGVVSWAEVEAARRGRNAPRGDEDGDAR